MEREPDNSESQEPEPTGPESLSSPETGQLDALVQVNRRRLVVNAAANYGRFGVSLIVGLFLQAYIIRTLGKAEYSIWPLVSTVTTFISVIPVAIAAGTGRFLGHALARKDLKDVEEITTSVFAALLVSAGIYTIGVVTFSMFFERVFDIPEGAVGIGTWVMLLAGISGAIRIPVSVFQAGLNAAQKYVAINLREIALLVLRAVLTVLVFTTSEPNLIWVAVVYLLVEGMGAIVTWTLARRIVPWQRIRRNTFNWKTLWRVSSFSAWAVVGGVAGLLYWQTDNVVINKLLDPALVTGYSVVANIVLQAYSLAMLGSWVLNPAATIMHAQNDLPRMTRMVYRANRFTVTLGVPAIAFLMLFGRPVLSLYLGSSEYTEYGILFSILGGALVLSLTQGSGRSVPQACGKNAINNAASLLAAAANVGLSLYFVVVLEWGLIGVAAGTAVVTVIHQMVFWPWYVARLLGVRWRHYFAATVVIPLAHCLPACGLLGLLRLSGWGSSAGGLIGILLMAAAFHGVYMLARGLYSQDREAIMRTLRRLC